MKSVEELEKVANAGDSTAQYELGVKYREGNGVPVDKETAFKWILTVAENVAPQAMLLLPEIYGRGEGVEVDIFRLDGRDKMRQQNSKKVILIF